MSNNSLNLESIFKHHGNQFLKFYFLPFLNVQERTSLRGTCKNIKKNVPSPQYSYVKAKDATARIETNTGFVETCGDPEYGGDSSEISFELVSGVKSLISGWMGFACLKTNGRVITWGHPFVDASAVSSEIQSDVKAIFSDDYGAFAALKTNGKVITWGWQPDFDHSTVMSTLQSDVESIFCNGAAFAALKKNGKVITWGDPKNGGDSSEVSSELQKDIKTIVYNKWSFAALTKNGKVVTWGRCRICTVALFLQRGVIKIEYVGDNEIRAIKSDGSSVQWW